MTTYFLAVDGGSQSTKVSVVDATGTVHAAAQSMLRPYELGPGGSAVHPADDLWDTLGEATRRALAAFAGSPSDIVGVGLCSIRSCRALVDEDGHLTEPVLSWMDARIPRPLADVDPEVATVTSAGGYLAIRLTGRRRDSSASYDGVWPIDLETRNWSADHAVVEGSGMPIALLAELVDPGGLLGEVTPLAAAHTGLPPGVPVFATGNDKAVEALGCGLAGESTLLLSLGTYVTAMTVCTGIAGPDPAYWVNAHAIPGRFLLESGGVRRGMWTVSWLRDLVSSAAAPPLDAEAVTEWLNAGAAEVPPGSDGLMTVPDWLAPGHAAYRRGAIVGLHGAHGPHHLYRSVLEGLALTMRGHVDAMGAALGRSWERVLVSGGGSRSPVMTQIVADVLGLPVEHATLGDAAGAGAAICAALGSGTHPDVETAIKAMGRTGEVVEPKPASVRRYEEIRDVYADLTTWTDPMFERMASLQR